MSKGMPPKLLRLFNAMKKADLALDDMDIVTESPKYAKAMEAARAFNAALEKYDDATKWKWQP